LTQRPDPDLVFDQRYPAPRILDVLGDKWTPILLYCIGDGVRRFNEMQRSIPEIPKNMLSRTLRDLEGKGLVERTVYPVVPPKTEYRLTPLGQRLREPISWLCEWAAENEDVLHQVDGGGPPLRRAISS
jgi:DNA-binding HxlR family transcriptional regulator